MNDVLVSVFARTDTGMRRSQNEDAFLIADLTTGKIGLGPDVSTHRIGGRGSLMVVSDGMGGAVAGEIASELAVKTLSESLLQMPYGLNVSSQLNKAAEAANYRIWEQAQQNPELKGMGATLTAVLVQGGMAYIAQVGDSRAYLVRGEQIKQITKDQSFIQMLIDKGAIKPDQANSVPQNVIMQALGTQASVSVALTSVELYRNDYLIVCSDGLTGKIEPDELRRHAQESPDLITACRRLVEIANQRGGEDNITVIVAKFDGVGLNTAVDSASITGSFNVINDDYINEETAVDSAGTPSPAPPKQPETGTKTLGSDPPAASDKPAFSTPEPVDPQTTQVYKSLSLENESRTIEPATVSHKGGRRVLLTALGVGLLIIAAYLVFYYFL